MGWMILVDQKIKGQHHIRVEYSESRFKDISNNDHYPWTFCLIKKKSFVPNPEIEEGNEKQLKLSIMLDNLKFENFFFSELGWQLIVSYHKSFGGLEKEGFYLTGKHKRLMWGLHKMMVTWMAGFEKGTLAHQNLMKIGGPGNLRAFSNRFRAGQNFVFLRTSYNFSGDMLRFLHLKNIPFFRYSEMGLFIETGDAWNNSTLKSSLFEGVSDLGLCSDFGVSIYYKEFFRIDFAYPIKGGAGKFIISGRILSL